MGKTNFSHELAISDGTNEIGLTLLKKKGIPQYFETFDYAQAAQFFNDPARSYTRFEATRRITLAQQDYTNGFGKEYSGGVSRYHTGVNIDARFTGEVRAGPLATSVTIPIVTTIADSITNPTVSAGQTTDQDLTWDDEYQGRVFYFTSKATSGGSASKIAINDGVGTTTSGNIDNGETVTISRKLDASATRLRLQFLADAGAQTIFSNSALGQPVAGAISDQVDFNSKRYASYGNILMKLDADGDEYTYIYSFETTITDLQPATLAETDYLLILLGWSNDNWQMVAAETFTESDLTNAEIKYITEADGTATTTWYASNTNSTIMRTVNPLNGGTNWANSNVIGEDAYDIVSIVTFQGLPYIKKSNGKVFYLDSSNNIIVLIDGVSKADGTDTAQMFVWREEALIIPYGDQGLFHYDGTTLTHIAPALFMNNATDFSGNIQAVAGDDMCLYIVMDDGADVQVMSSKIGASVADWGWHTLSTQTITGCASAGISSVYKKRMWVGSTTGAENFRYIPVTTKYGDIANDSDYTYQTGGSIETSFQTVDLPEDTKAWLKLTVRMSGTSSTKYWRAYYQLLGGSFVEINSTPKFKTSPQTEADISTGSSPITSTMMKLKFEPVTNNTAVSPVLLGWKLEALWYPDEHKLIACTVLVDKLIPNTLGMRDPTTTATIISALDNINASSWRAFYPPYFKEGDSAIYVKKLPIDRGLELIQLDKGNAKEGEAAYVYHLLLEKIDVS